jgi:hypothetical protein
MSVSVIGHDCSRCNASFLRVHYHLLNSEDYFLLGCNAVQSGRNLSTFQRNMLLKSEKIHSEQKVSIPIHSYTLKMDSTCSSATFVPIYKTKRCHVPEDINFLIHRFEILKSYLFI